MTSKTTTNQAAPDLAQLGSGQLDPDQLEQLARILDRYGLTRLEYSQADTQVVLERRVKTSRPDPKPTRESENGQEVALPVVARGAEGVAVAPRADSFAQDSATATDKTAADEAQTATDDICQVKAPLVGIVYRSREPGVAAFVEVGSQVAEGDVLCLIEAMKMFSEIKAPCAGTVRSIHFEDATLVEYGAPLVSLG